MKNPTYTPETAHLPSKQDKANWKNGGKAKHLREVRRIKATVERFEHKERVARLA
jgi:hypothetical protein